MKKVFIVEKEIQESPCEHPMCEQFHKRFMVRGNGDNWYHETKVVWWLVIDTRTGNQVDNGMLKKDMKRSADYQNAKLEAKLLTEQNQEED